MLGQVVLLKWYTYYQKRMYSRKYVNKYSYVFAQYIYDYE